MQVVSWQFQTMYEGAETYYSNEYGDSDYVTITRVAAFLRENGYDEIAEPYGLAAADCEQYQYPKDKMDLLPDDWIETHEQVIWDFYVDILEKHKEDLAWRTLPGGRTEFHISRQGHDILRVGQSVQRRRGWWDCVLPKIETLPSRTCPYCGETVTALLISRGRTGRSKTVISMMPSAICRTGT